MKSVPTSLGEIQLREPSSEDVEALRSRWPFGLVGEPGAYELLFSDPVGAMAGLYLPHYPVEAPEQAAEILAQGRAALARGLGKLALYPEPLEGVLLGCAVLREESAAQIPGLAFFAVPDPGAPASTGTAAQLERDLEPGSGGLLDRGLDLLAASRRGLPPVRDVKVTGAPYMGARHLDFVVVGRRLFCLHEEPRADDPVWEALAKAQVKEVLHLPCAGVRSGVPGPPRQVSSPDDSEVGPALQPEPAEPEPVASEPAEPEPAKPEPAASEPAKPEPAASEPAASEPAESEPAEREPAESEPAASEPAESEPAASPASPESLPGAPALGSHPSVARAPLLGLTPRGTRRVYRFLWHLAACDGEVHESERAVLASYRERFGLSPEDAALLEAEGRRGEHLTIGKRAVERVLLLDALLDVAAADGRLDRAEEKRLVALGNLLKVSRSEIRRSIQERFAHQETDVVVIESKVCSLDPDMPTLRGVRRIYRLLWNLAACDGHLARGEIQLLEAFRVRHAISRQEARSLEREGRLGRSLQVSQSETERRLLANELIDLAAIDGTISLAERRRILKLGTLLRMDRTQLERSLRERAKALAKNPLLETEPGLLDPDPARVVPASPAAAAEPGQSASDGAAPESTSGPALPTDAESQGKGVLILLGLPPGALLSLDLRPLEFSEGSLGLRQLGAGVHRLEVTTEAGEIAAWIRLGRADVQVLRLEGRSLASASSREVTDYLSRVRSGSLESSLVPVRADAAWSAITAPLRHGPFPPLVHPPSTVHPNRRLEETWLELYRGEGDALEAEVAYSFLLGLFGASDALARWSSLVQAIYHCGDELPLRDPVLFADLVDLLIAQQRLLPREQLETNTPAGSGAHYLSEDLEDTAQPHLIEAARRWATFCGGYHPGAPEPIHRPQSLLQPQRSAASKLHAASLQAAERALVDAREEHGPHSARLIPLLAHLSQVQELGSDLFAAIRTQQLLLVLAGRNKVPSDLLAKGLLRVARLQREVGRGREADRLEAQALATRG